MEDNKKSKLSKYGGKIDSDELNSFFPPVYIDLLKHHFDAIGRNAPQVNLLVGLYGIGKNAVVKQLAEEYGFRVVHIRLPYLSDLDFYGHGYDPSLDFFSCTDEYLEFARGMVNLLKKRLLLRHRLSALSKIVL